MVTTMGLLDIRQNPVTSAADNIKTSLSSWDGCMSHAYCKYVSPVPAIFLDPTNFSHRWPVIVGIVIGSLIILSVIACIARCVCCGAECACCCFRCCTGCCSSNERRGYNKQGTPPTPYPPQPYNQPYQSQPPLQYGSPQPGYNSGKAQYATFDVSKPVNEDSLPPMPSWNEASSKKIQVIEEPESHEMDKLNKDGLAPSGAPKLPAFDSSPAEERDKFIGSQTTGVIGHGDSSSGYRGSAPVPAQVNTGYSNQAYGGYTRGYAPQRSPQPSPPPQAAVGYGNRPGYDRNNSYGSQQRSPISPVEGYGGAQREYPNQQYGQSQPQYGRQNSGSPRNQSSPVYAPSGSTAYEPQNANNQYDAYNSSTNTGGNGAYPGQPYGNQRLGDTRRPVQGSWRDV